MAIGDDKTRLRCIRGRGAYSSNRICAFVTDHALITGHIRKNPTPARVLSGAIRRDITSASLCFGHACNAFAPYVLCPRRPPGRAAIAQQGAGQRRRTPRAHHRSGSLLRQRRPGSALVPRHDAAHAGDVRCARAPVCVFHLWHALGNQCGLRRCARARGADPRARTAGRGRPHAGRARRRAGHRLDHRPRPPGAGVRRDRRRQRAGSQHCGRAAMDRRRRRAASVQPSGNATHRHPQGGRCALAVGGCR